MTKLHKQKEISSCLKNTKFSYTKNFKRLNLEDQKLVHLILEFRGQYRKIAKNSPHFSCFKQLHRGSLFFSFPSSHIRSYRSPLNQYRIAGHGILLSPQQLHVTYRNKSGLSKSPSPILERKFDKENLRKSRDKFDYIPK